MKILKTLLPILALFLLTSTLSAQTPKKIEVYMGDPSVASISISDGRLYISTGNANDSYQAYLYGPGGKYYSGFRGNWETIYITPQCTMLEVSNKSTGKMVYFLVTW